MFGLRYHVASLAAVFVALALGILLGVAVSGKVTDVGEDAELQNLRDDNEQLEQELEAAQAQAEAATAQGEGAEELFARAYPTLMDGRLEGEDVAVVFLGPVDGSVRAEVEGALADADGGAPGVVALELPVDGANLRTVLEEDELLAEFVAEENDFSDLGRELGQELVEAEETPLWDALATTLVEERSGTISNPIDSVVVVLNWTPTEEVADDEAGAETEATVSFTDGLVSGLDASAVPVVGVATADDPEDLVDFYRDRGLSSVDNIDSLKGRLALALLLAGAEPGHYGIREGAIDGSVPPVEPVTTEGE